MRTYEKLAAFDQGYGIHETGEASPSGSKFAKKPAVSLVPLDGLMRYYANLDVLKTRLEKAAILLARRYNGLSKRRPVEWRDEICRHEFVGVNGRPETTIFELRETTFGFHVAGHSRPADVSDLRVQ
jgi:hypothetical protein